MIYDRKKIFLFFLILPLLLCISVPASAAEARVIDTACLLTDEESRQLLSVLDEVSERLQFDVIFASADDTGDESIQEYTDRLFDARGYGMGEARDGVLLFVDMGNREIYINTAGYGVTAISEDAVNTILDAVVPYFSEGSYYDGCICFAAYVEDFVTAAWNVNPYDTVPTDDAYEDERIEETESIEDIPEPYIYAARFDFGRTLTVAVVIGAVVSLLTVNSIKGKLKTVRANDKATDYMVPDSLQIPYKREIYLYRTVSVTVIQTDKPGGPSNRGGSSHGSFSGHGGSSHISSSGVSHGGGGRKF